MKDFHIVGTKMARIGHKMTIYLMQILMINLDPFSQDLAWPQSTFCVITFEPIKVKTCSAPQIDRLNLSFVKYIHVDGENLA